MKFSNRRKFLQQTTVSLLAMPFILRSARAERLTSIGRPKIRTAIREVLEKAPLGASHAHAYPEHVRLKKKMDLFSVILSDGPQRDILTTGYGDRPPAQIGNQQLSIRERWKLFEPLLAAGPHTPVYYEITPEGRKFIIDKGMN